MKRWIMIVVSLAFSAMALASAGCGGAHAVMPAKEIRTGQTETLVFGKLTGTANTNDKRPDGAREIVELGASLSSRGKHANAAGVFLKACKLGASDGRFYRACVSAAAAEYAMAGERGRFKDAMRILKAQMNEFERLNPGPRLEILLMLDRCRAGTDLEAELDRIARQSAAHSTK